MEGQIIMDLDPDGTKEYKRLPRIWSLTTGLRHNRNRFTVRLYKLVA
jgi:hypothetical protein